MHYKANSQQMHQRLPLPAFIFFLFLLLIADSVKSFQIFNCFFI